MATYGKFIDVESQEVLVDDAHMTPQMFWHLTQLAPSGACAYRTNAPADRKDVEQRAYVKTQAGHIVEMMIERQIGRIWQGAPREDNLIASGRLEYVLAIAVWLGDDAQKTLAQLFGQ